MSEIKSVFITGGTGLVGAPLINLLVQQGYKVNALYRNNAGIEKFKRIVRYYSPDAETIYKKVNWIKGDLLDVDTYGESIKKEDMVIHAAALVSFNKKDKERVNRVNIKGTEQLVNLALNKEVKRFIYVSSIAAIGKSLETGKFSEQTFPVRYNSTYAYSKTKAELELWRGFEEGMEGVIVNPSVIIGPGEWNSGSARLFKAIQKGMPFYTQGVTGYIDVRDVVEGIFYFLKSGITKERYILSSENISYGDLFTRIANQLGKKPPQFPVTLSLINAIHFLTGNLFITKEMKNSALNKSEYTAAKYLKRTGKNFRKIDEAIQFTATCFKRER